MKVGDATFARGLVDRDIHLSTFAVPLGIDWGGRSLAELGLGRRYGVHVASIQRGPQRINIPSARTLILPGDQLQVIGSDKQLSAFGQALEAKSEEAAAQQKPVEEMMLRRIMLTFGSYIVGETIRESGIRDQFHCLIVAVEVEGNEGLLAPDPTQTLHIGDIIWVVGEEGNIAELENAREMPHHRKMGKGKVQS